MEMDVARCKIICKLVRVETGLIRQCDQSLSTDFIHSSKQRECGQGIPINRQLMQPVYIDWPFLSSSISLSGYVYVAGVELLSVIDLS